MPKILYAVLIPIILAISGLIFFLSFGETSPRENGILSLLLTFCSVSATWIITHQYSVQTHKDAIEDVKSFHQENLRIYAHKAWEKVNNLSLGLTGLSAYLQQELDDAEYESDQMALQAAEAMLASAIHTISILKSQNDTSMSDWEGVIGEELSERRETQEEREEILRDITSDLKELMTANKAELAESSHDETLYKEIEDIKKSLAFLASDVSGIPARNPHRRPRRKTIHTIQCPVCSTEIKYRQRTKKNNVKAISCPSCRSKFVSQSVGDETFEIRSREVIRETILCPFCNQENSVDLDELPSANTTCKCEQCKQELRISRASDGVRVTEVQDLGSIKPSEDFIQSVNAALPDQPWPKHIHKQIAKELATSNALVQRAIRELIDRGEYLQQIDGVLYSRASEKDDRK